jgi:hypothetical protein
MNTCTGSYNVAIGFNTLFTSRTGSVDNNYNVAIGVSTMSTINGCTDNIVIGRSSLSNSSGASNNIIAGVNNLTTYNRNFSSNNIFGNTNLQTNSLVGSSSNNIFGNNFDVTNHLLIAGSNNCIFGNDNNPDSDRSDCIMIGNNGLTSSAITSPHIVFSSVSANLAATGSAIIGSATALPALPGGYIMMVYNNNVIKIPYYN